MWEAIQYVGTPIGLLAFLAAVITAAFYYYIEQRTKIKDSLPDDRRWQILNKEIEGYNLTHDNLTREQKFSLMKSVISEKAARRRQQTPIIAGITIIFLILLTAISILYYKNDVKKMKYSNSYLTLLFGATEDGAPRVTTIDAARNISVLNEAFSKSKSSIKIVTELGNTWLLGSNYQALKSSLDRSVKISILIMDFNDRESVNLARYSTQKGEGKQGYTPDEVIRNLEIYATLVKSKAPINLSAYNEYPWVRFTLFDDSAVSFVLRPMLNISRPQPMYSTDPLIIKMFEGIFNKLEKSSRKYNTVEDIERLVNQVGSSAVKQ